MTARTGGVAWRALALVFVPALVWAGAWKWASRPVGPGLQAEAVRLVEETAGSLSRVAADALDSSATAVHHDWLERFRAGRLEGVGIFPAGENYFEWEGTPAEVPADWSVPPGRPAWRLQRTGAFHRLLAVQGPDDSGRCALATLLLEGGSSALLRAIQWTPDDDAVPAGAEATAPDGTVLAVVRATDRRLALGPSPARFGAACAAAALVALALLLVPWGRIVATPRGSLLAAAAAVAGRWVLLATHAPAVLLPRPMGAPSLYGTAGLAGLAASPADALLSAITLILVARAARGAARAGGESGPRRVVVALASAAIASGAAAWLASSFPRDSRVDLLRLVPALGSPGRLLVVASLALLLAEAVRWWSAAWGAMAGPRRARRLSATLVGGAVLLALSSGLGWTVLRGEREVAVDLLRSEYRVQVKDQSSSRRVALRSAVQVAAADLERLERWPDRRDSTLAFRLWASGPMDPAGFRSSLTVYDETGQLVSHFGFGIPLLDEVLPTVPAPEPGEPFLEEFAPVETVEQRLLHLEVPLAREGRGAGLLVGHVLEEPDNLPFLPGQREYLAVLGSSEETAPDEAPEPDYVLYDAAGLVRFSTVPQPPPWKVEFDKAGLQDAVVRVESGNEPYIALPVLETDRLHLLLLETRTAPARLGVVVRIALLAVLALVALELGPAIFRSDRRRRLLDGVRGSFSRRLAATLVVASLVPLVGLSLTLRASVRERAQTDLQNEAIQLAVGARRVLEDYSRLGSAEGDVAIAFGDPLLLWLREVVGHDIVLYEDGILTATSRRSLFTSGRLPPRLTGEVYRKIVQENRPPMVVPVRLGGGSVPIAYTPVHLDDPRRRIVIAVPSPARRGAADRAVAPVVELLLLTTVALAALLAVAAAVMAGTAARPVRELVEATARIADGRYGTRLQPRTKDEFRSLVDAFNAMAAALARQRADLERRRDYMEALLENATTGVVSTDAEDRIVTRNPAAGKLLGSEAALAVGLPLAEAVAGVEGYRPLADLLTAPFRGGEPSEVDVRLEDGVRRIRLVRVALPDPEGGPPGTLALVDDVTDLMRSNQLEAWAEMARAIAHEIKNPLTPIQLSTEHLERILRDRDVLPSEEIESCIRTVMKQVRALREIAAEFSAYAKLPALQPEDLDPVAFLEEVMSPYVAAPPPGVEIRQRYDACPAARIDAKVLGRALVNLVENALQSMPDGGTLGIEAEGIDGGSAVRLTVRDTGTGLSPEVRDRLFEPYFSTKSSGTGLGLAIVRRAVEAHGGSIEVESREGEGTAFRIRIPTSRADSRAASRGAGRSRG